MLAEHMFGPHNDSPITISNPEEFAMPKLKLTYFDFDGGRGEPARLALHIGGIAFRSEEHTSELQSRLHLVCRLLLEKKKKTQITDATSIHKQHVLLVWTM